MDAPKDYTRDIAEIRSMMERSSKFLLLSGWAGIMAGIYALAGAYLIYANFNFNEILRDRSASRKDVNEIILIALGVLILAVGTTAFLANLKASNRGEKLWNPVTVRLLVNMAVPLACGAVLVAVMISRGYFAIVPPLTLIFYGLALFNASRLTFGELQSLGIIQIVLGLLSAFVGFELFFWAFGFGILHIAYGIVMHFKYER